MKRILSAFFAGLLLISLTACGQKPVPQETGFRGLVLKAPSDVQVVLMTGFDAGTSVAPAQTDTEGDYTYYRYTGLEGAYRCISGGLGYYRVTKNIVVTAADNQKETLVDVTPEKMVGTGWEAKEVQIFADSLRNGAFSDDPAQWPAYADVFTTPWFTQQHGKHQITTQSQMEDYLKLLDDPDDNLYLYSAGMTGTYRNDIPMAVFTTADLSQAKTPEQMAKALDNGKPIVLYRAQVHGIEPASGEAALAVIGLLDGGWGGYLENMNVCIIPRATPDSAQNFTRYVNGAIEPNQDCLRLETDEVAAYIEVCRLLTPEVIIDGHEYQCHVVDSVVEGGDILVGIGYTVENTQVFRALGLEMAAGIFEATQRNALTSRYYTDLVSTGNNANGSRSYAGNMGSVFFLLESRGIGMGTQLYPRRIISHVISVESLLGYIHKNPQKVMDTVEAERREIIEKGSIYAEENRLPLEIKSQPNEALNHTAVTYDQLTGQATQITVTPKEMSKVTHSVAAPTAYVIPAEESFTKKVLKLLDGHGIVYTRVSEGSKIRLQQYSENGLLEEATVVFPGGAYVICRNQLQGRNLYHLFEPNIPTHGETKGTLVAQGIIDSVDGKYPLYRYVHDLNEQGFIDYK